MLYQITDAVAHANHTVTITWADGARGSVDLTRFVARGELFAALQDPAYFVREMSILRDGIGLTWPNEVDFSADGLRQDAFPADHDGEHGDPVCATSRTDSTLQPASSTKATSGYFRSEKGRP